MSHAVSLSVPCLGTSKPYYSRDGEGAAVFDTKTKVVLVVSLILTLIGIFLLQFRPLVWGACFVTAGVGSFFIALFNLIKSTCTHDSNLEKLEKLEAAKELAAGLEIPPTLLQELEQVVPAIDAIEEDHRIASIHYNCNKTATFTLKTAPDLQFRISPPAPTSNLGCSEWRLARLYENTIYAHQICRSENYDSLLIPPIKPIYLKVGGLRRAMLVGKIVQGDRLPVGDLKRAVRQTVQFLLKTGGSGHSDPFSLIPVEGNKLALQNLHHLTENPHPDPWTREALEIGFITNSKNSLLTSLNREDLINIALDELKKWKAIPVVEAIYGSLKQVAQARLRRIQEAGEIRLNQIRNPVPINVRSEHAAAPNVLGISPEELGLDLGLKDYAVIQHKGVHSDGISRIITLGEAAQAIIHCINRKLQADPTNNKIEFTAEDMLIGEKLPCFTWEEHYQYNMLQGLGYREWPDPNKEPPYWMALVLQSLKNKGLITDFTLHRGSNPKLRVNLTKLRKTRAA